MNKNIIVMAFCLAIIITLLPCCRQSVRITEHLDYAPGDVNGVRIRKDGRSLLIYGDPLNEFGNAEMILFTHFRRDIVWAGSDAVKGGSLSVVPAREKVFFTSCDSLWEDLYTSRFHEYNCQTTRFPFIPLRADRDVRGGDTLVWNDILFRVLDTPGYTRGAVTYLAEIDGRNVAFTGDLILGDGKIPDLYSFQDSTGEISGYHGYAARLVKLVSSLELVGAQKPDIIIPARGPVITNPEVSIRTLISRIRRLYSNYLSISAYRWYYPGRVDILSEKILGRVQVEDMMPSATLTGKDALPWYIHISNSNLVMADDSSAFLIDCGVRDAFDSIVTLKNSGRLRKLDGMFITHYHDDHTDLINDVIREFGCPVYITGELKDILEHPSAYHLPCLTTQPVSGLTVMNDGARMKWKDFNLTFRYFPGQTIYHDAVLFEKDNGEAIFFSGDSFTPSGIDDYCLLNRNFLHPGNGYFYCIDILKRLPQKTFLSNQHVAPLFRFSGEQLDQMEAILSDRLKILNELLPPDDLNYGLDEEWARIYPYGQEAVMDGSLEYSVIIYNHSAEARKFTLKPSCTKGFTVSPAEASVLIAPQSEGERIFRVSLSGLASPGVHPLGMSVGTGDQNLHDWCECLVKVTK